MIRVVDVRGLRGKDRESVCYVGRRWAGWPQSPWHNPYRPAMVAAHAGSVASRIDPLAEALRMFRKHAGEQRDSWLADLWEACEHGAKPLGCYCVNATHGDGQPIVCHAQILAAMLAERFLPVTTGANQ